MYIYISILYSIASVTEWILHKYWMHSEKNKDHKYHHATVTQFYRQNKLIHEQEIISPFMLVQSNAKLPIYISYKAPLDDLIFGWNFTFGTFFSTWFLSSAFLYSYPFHLIQYISTPVSIEYHTIVVLCFAFGFSMLWNTLHLAMHHYEGPSYSWRRAFPRIPVSNKTIIKLFPYHYHHHIIHHQNPNYNYNVIYLGADAVFGSLRIVPFWKK